MNSGASTAQGAEGLLPMRRRGLHRAVFVAAGIYNLAWGARTVVDPAWALRTHGLPVAEAPEIFAGLGMVVGLYGIVYLEVARAPERGWVPAAVGLAGKVIGPIAVAWFVVTGRWPAQALTLTVGNDLIWWVPFALYLRDAWPGFLLDLRRSSGRALARSARASSTVPGLLLGVVALLVASCADLPDVGTARAPAVPQPIARQPAESLVDPRPITQELAEGFSGILWLPDGWIVLNPSSPHEEWPNPELWRMRPDGSSLEVLLDEQLPGCFRTDYLALSPLWDGRAGTVRTCWGSPYPDDPSYARSAWHLIAVDPEDGSVEELAEVPFPADFAWDTTAERGLASKDSGICSGIALVTPEGVEALAVEVGEGEQRFRIDEWVWRSRAEGCEPEGLASLPSVSPDGGFAFFASPESVGVGGFAKSSVPRNLYRMDLDTLRPEVVTEDINRPSGMQWSPDGRFVAFRGEIEGRDGLWVIEMATGKPWLISDEPLGGPAWSPDGTQMVALRALGKGGQAPPQELVVLDVPERLLRAG